MPVADIATARTAIVDGFRAYWNANAPSPVPELRYQDVLADKPASDEAWAEIEVRHSTSGQSTLGEEGGRRFTRTGVVTVKVFTPLGDALTLSDQLVKVAMDAFEGKTLSSGAIWFRDVRSNEIGPQGDPWFQVNVLADFEYDEVK